MKKLILCILIFAAVFSSFFKDDSKIKIYSHNDGKVIKMDLEKYIEGVVAAEMPASFEEEALKAQAVAARTYALEKLSSSWNDPSHHGARLCTNSAHCQAFKDISASDKNSAKIKNAVASTRGEAAAYNGKPIKAFYHSASPGRTKDCADVWGGDLPYLKAVESPWDMVNPDFESVTDETCHGVGMSQWGAQGMALEGYSYKEILMHYYTGIEVEKYIQ